MRVRIRRGWVVALREAVAGLVSDGNSVAVEGLTHLIPTAGAHEIIRQQRRNLTLILMTPDLIYDQMIGMGWRARAELLRSRLRRSRWP